MAGTHCIWQERNVHTFPQIEKYASHISNDNAIKLEMNNKEIFKTHRKFGNTILVYNKGENSYKREKIDYSIVLEQTVTIYKISKLDTYLE